jgi:hypothetical protein
LNKVTDSKSAFKGVNQKNKFCRVNLKNNNYRSKTKFAYFAEDKYLLTLYYKIYIITYFNLTVGFTIRLSGKEFSNMSCYIITLWWTCCYFVLAWWITMMLCLYCIFVCILRCNFFFCWQLILDCSLRVSRKVGFW